MLVVTHSWGPTGHDVRVSGKAGMLCVKLDQGMLCLVRLDLAVIVNQSFCFVPCVQKIFALVEYLHAIFLSTLPCQIMSAYSCVTWAHCHHGLQQSIRTGHTL